MRYDLIVIGSGPGGYVAASQAGALGKKVLLVERDELGGVCANRGCIPTKSLLHGAKVYRRALNGGKFGVHVEGSYSLSEAMAWKDEAVATLRSGIAFLEKKNHVDVLRGEAVFLDEHHVRVGEEIREAEAFIIATGSSPSLPPLEGIEGAVTSDDLFSLSALPSSVAIIGGGVIGIEFASYFSLLGVKVDVIEMMDEILPLLDGDLSRVVRRANSGVTFHLGCRVERLEGGTVTFRTKKGGEESVTSALVVVATGRKPMLDVLGSLSLERTKRGIVVDEHMRSSIGNIYAIGDVTGLSLLAHSARKMADVAISSLYGDGSIRFDASRVPWAVYGSPEASGWGLTEAKAREAGLDVVSSTVFFRGNGRFLAEEGKRGNGECKLIARREDGRIVGVHIVGPSASEMIWPFAREWRDDELASLIFPHPSFNEVIHECALSLRERRTV